jgi:hypothetical protein
MMWNLRVWASDRILKGVVDEKLAMEGGFNMLW